MLLTSWKNSFFSLDSDTTAGHRATAHTSEKCVLEGFTAEDTSSTVIDPRHEKDDSHTPESSDRSAAATQALTQLKLQLEDVKEEKDKLQEVSLLVKLSQNSILARKMQILHSENRNSAVNNGNSMLGKYWFLH